MLTTRAVERKKVLKASVLSARLLQMTERSITLKTTAILAAHRNISSADSEMASFGKSSQIGQEIEGRIVIDVKNDDVIRIRYAEGTSVPLNETPMVVGDSGKPSRCLFVDNSTKEPSNITISTSQLSITIALKPYTISVSTKKGEIVCSIGGPEKDYFNNMDSMNTGISRGPNDNMIGVENFTLSPDEGIYGLGEKFMQLNKNGQTIDLFMDDALGVTTPRTYKNVPFFVSSKGYGVYFNHSSPMTFWVGSLSACDTQVAVHDNFLDYYVFTGSIKHIFSRYTDLTGKGALPPKWSFGYWQSKISYKAADEVLEIARTLRKKKIPCDVIHLDTFWFAQDWRCDLEFDKERFPDRKAFIDELKAMGIKVSLWQLPYIPEGSKLFDDLASADGFVKNTDGSIYNSGMCLTPDFKGIVGVIDYTNPAAVAIHQAAFRKLFELGVKVIKTDFGEAAPFKDVVYFDKTPSHQMHNLYPLLYNKAIFEITKEVTGDGIVWARSAWAGNQRYPLHWGGDNSPNFENMLPQLAGGLSLGMSGFQFWSQDIGGFLGNTNDTLLIRWMQVGVFASHSRIHGMGDRELYKFKPRTQSICRDYINLRYRLMPYILGSSKVCVADSLPMLRALVVEYQDDPNVINMFDEYLFGREILVAPILTKENTRKVYLPQGVWTDWWTGERFTGTQWINVSADIATLPLFIREGAIIAQGPIIQYVDEKKVDQIDLTVSLFTCDNKNSFVVPVNDEWVKVDYICHNKKHTITIGLSDVKFRVKILGKGRVTLKGKNIIKQRA